MPDPTATVRFTSYNTQWCTGLDGVTDVDRVAREIGDSDIIALQEIDRFWGRSAMADQPAELSRRLPKYHWAYGPGIDMDASIVGDDGHVLNRRRQFGNMVLSRWPILAVRNHMLPKRHLLGPMSLQRAALETVVHLPDGPCRVVSTHLAHAAATERLAQIGRLRKILRRAPDDGAPWSGRDYETHWAEDAPQQTPPSRTVVMGDFNMLPQSAEYDRMCGPADAKYGPLSTMDGLSDAWVAAGGAEDAAAATVPDGRRIDFVFVTGTLTDAVRGVSVDSKATGSDHWPVHMELAVG